MKILQLSKKFPYPLKDGEAIAIVQMSKALHDNGCQVDLLAMNTSRHKFHVTAPMPIELNHYAKIRTVEVNNDIRPVAAFMNLFSSDSYHISRYLSTEFEAELIHLLKEQHYDVIQLETLYLAPYLDIIKKYSEALIVMRAHNIEHEIWERIAHQIQFIPKKWYLSYLSKKLRRFEIGKLNEYDFLVAITDRDLDKFKELGYKNGCLSSPVGFDFSDYHPDYKSFSKPLSLCFIGSLDWMPNQEGILWFLQEVWPKVHNAFPQLEFHFAGRKPPKTISSIQLPNVFFHGDIADAKQFINQHSLMLVPLFAGSGIRVKILEAMALGKVVIATPIGMEGIEAKDRQEILIARDELGIIKAIEFCYEHASELEQIGKNACHFVQTKFNSRQLSGKLLSAYKETIGIHSKS